MLLPKAVVRIGGVEVEVDQASLSYSHNRQGPEAASFDTPVEIEMGGVVVWEGSSVSVTGLPGGPQ